MSSLFASAGKWTLSHPTAPAPDDGLHDIMAKDGRSFVPKRVLSHVRKDDGNRIIAARELVQTIARMSLDGEDQHTGDGSTFTMTAQDARDTLSLLIHRARTILEE